MTKVFTPKRLERICTTLIENHANLLTQFSKTLDPQIREQLEAAVVAAMKMEVPQAGSDGPARTHLWIDRMRSSYQNKDTHVEGNTSIVCGLIDEHNVLRSKHKAKKAGCSTGTWIPESLL
jgi:hypothetical protein